MQDEIGATAGMIWLALNGKEDLALVQLKREVKGRTPLFDWAIGWPARENKLVITPDKRSFRVRLNEAQASASAAS
jgi:hypothetical protein